MSHRPSLDRSGAAQTPMAFVQAVLQAYAQRGLEPTKALIKAQITPTYTQDATQCVTAAQFERLCHAAMQELDDEAPGWFSRRLPWGSYGMLARASISAPSLGVALSRWCRHHGLLTRDVTLTLTVQGDEARLVIDEHRPLGMLREFVLLSLLRNLHGLACWLVDLQLPLGEAHFPFAAPHHVHVYERLFPGPLRFGAAQAGLRFNAHALALPLRRDAAALDQMLRRALPILVWPYRHDHLLSHRVRQLMRRPGTAHIAETLASALTISPRSLHRQLRAEGTSLQQLKDETRQALAKELLLRTRQPISRVARAVGFQNDKSFIRAFKGWTGFTPTGWRERTG